MANQKTEIDMRAPSPFQIGVKVARISRGGYGTGTGTVERSVVESVIRKGARAGRFRVMGWDGDHEAAQEEDGSWRATVSGSWRGRVILDDERAAEIEREFEIAKQREELDRVCRDVSLRAMGMARETLDGDLASAIALMTDIASRLPAKP